MHRQSLQGRVHMDHDERWICFVISWHANHARARSDDSRYVLLLEGYGNLPLCGTPEKKRFFAVDETAKPLLEAEQKVFHTAVARLLHLSKKGRPDIMTVVAFLCTRVTRATIEDCLKLERVMGYLKKTKVSTLQLKLCGLL